jgi:HK97 family phage major capsid protein
MSAKPNDATQAVLGAIDKINTRVEALEKGLSQPVYPWGTGRAPFVTTGPVGRDSAGYSILRAAALCKGYLSPEQCKEEIEVGRQLAQMYRTEGGYAPTFGDGATLLVPFATEYMPQHTPECRKLAAEVREKCLAMAGSYDPEEARWISKRLGGAYNKALGTTSDAAGGVIVGFPTLGELIDLQRNLEAFPSAGATEVALPANARMQFPKLTGGSTAYWVGEGGVITESTQTTGNLDLQGKKLGILTKINNELLRYASPSAEGLVRTDMARVAALKSDLAMLEGTGGTQIKGLLNYDTATSWVSGQDKLLAYTSVGTPADGNSGYPFQPEDVMNMEAQLPDAVQAPTAWIVRKDWFNNIANRRADSVTAGDGKGPFLFSITRDIGMGVPMEMAGTKVIRTRQVSNTRTRGSGSTFTYALLGYFPDWVIARFGVMEFLTTNVGDTAFQNDQTWLRAIQILDAGARHAASFVLCDQLAFS